MWMLVACTGARTAPKPAETPPVHLTTRDGVELVADYWPPEQAGAGGIVLLHMIPPKFDRTTWPRPFVDRLRDLGFAVIAPDRRGAGDSGGNAVDAYQGPDGKYDVEACVKKLAADGAGPISIIGASNGTTSMLDYAEWAGSEGLPAPVALGFMTGGEYTEGNSPMSAIPKVPAVFTYSTDERAWSEAQRPLDPGTWSFKEYPHGAHGTFMFEAAPEVTDDLAAFFKPFAGG